ncbi:MAG TPA: VOC family protein, partial [Blastocatellia bacterium]
MQGFTTSLWFDDKAEEAANFYVSVFSSSVRSGSGEANSKVLAVTYYDEEGAKVSGRPIGSVWTVDFQLHGYKFTAFNGGPLFT